MHFGPPYWRPFPSTGHTGYLVLLIQQCFIFMKNSGTCQKKKQWNTILTEYKKCRYLCTFDKVLKEACGVKQNQTIVIFPPIFNVLYSMFLTSQFLPCVPGLAVAYIGTQLEKHVVGTNIPEIWVLGTYLSTHHSSTREKLDFFLHLSRYSFIVTK